MQLLQYNNESNHSNNNNKKHTHTHHTPTTTKFWIIFIKLKESLEHNGWIFLYHVFI